MAPEVLEAVRATSGRLAARRGSKQGYRPLGQLALAGQLCGFATKHNLACPSLFEYEDADKEGGEHN